MPYATQDQCDIFNSYLRPIHSKDISKNAFHESLVVSWQSRWAKPGEKVRKWSEWMYSP